MARLDDLNLADDPPRETPQQVIDFAEELNDLLDDERFAFAYDTLAGIRETIQRLKRVTPGQYTAVRNIRTSVEQKAERKTWGRRYEGHR